MTCHSQVWADAEVLEPVRASYATDRSIAWTRVHDLPDFVYFDHSVHVAQGVGCATCHGPVDQMPLAWREETLHMEWCLECHREPERFVGPRELVFASAANPADESKFAQTNWTQAYHVQSKTDCSVCHR